MARRHLYLQWDSTDLCNLRCSHCYHKKENENHLQGKELMSLEEIKAMIDDLKETSKRWEMIPDLAISGGEPLLRKNLYNILE